MPIENVEVGSIVLSEKSKIEFLESQVAMLTLRLERLTKRVKTLELVNAINPGKG